MWTSEHRLLSFDGTPLFFRILKAESKEPIARIFIVHGIGEHGGRYLPIAKHLAARGIESVVPDLRGFGRSGGPRAFADHPEDYHSDLSAIFLFAQKNRPQASLFFLGHSFGGLLAASLLAAGRCSANGLILSSPSFGLAKLVPSWRHALGVASAICAPKFSQKTSVVPEDLTHDEGLISLYKKDPLIYQRMTARLYSEFLKLMAERAKIAASLHIPMLILQAGDDRIVDPEKTRLFYREVASTDKKLQMYPGLYHELFNEKEREDIYQTVTEWLLSKIRHK